MVMWSPGEQMLLTVLLVALACHAALLTLRARHRTDAVARLCHLLMSVVMAAMIWPWWAARTAAAPQVILFAAIAAWFVLGARRHTAHDGGAHLWHAAMALAMVWMVIAMSGPPAAGGHHGQLSTPLALTGVVVTAAMLAGAVAFVVDALTLLRAGRRHWDGTAAEALASSAMCLGMAAMSWPMTTG